MHKLRTPEDIHRLPGYLSKVNPDQTPLQRIIQYYYIRPFDIQCALCGKHHMDGCIVELENGKLTNIGHICGDRFGERFSEEKRKFSESERKPELIKKLVGTSDKLSSMHFQFEDLKHRAGTLARRGDNFSEMFPDLHKELFRRALNNQHRVTTSVELSEKEITEAKAAAPYKSRDELRFRDVEKGTIRGHRFPAINWSLNDGVRSVFIEANKFAELTPRSMSMQDLTKWANWSDDLDEKISAVSSAIKEGEEFFSSENFRLFELLPATLATQKKLKSFSLRTLDQITVFEVQAGTQSSHRVKKPSLPQKPVLSARELRRLTGDKRAR